MQSAGAQSAVQVGAFREETDVGRGRAYTITVTLSADTASYKLTASSSKKKVAMLDTVSDKPGTFTIKAEARGKAKITIKTFNGKKATVTVTVQ